MATLQISPEVLEVAREKAAEFNPLGEEVGAPLPRSYSFPHWAQMQEVDKELHQACVNQGLIGVGRHFVDDILPAVRESKDESTPILITGETGTGKEVVARCTHQLGPRKNKPFLALNCGGLPSELLESELFGYQKGAFTGAEVQGKKGLLKAADGGTVFLDEIGDAPPLFQVKLLRFLNDRKFIPVGGTKEEKTDVRIIAATNKEIAPLIDRGQLRADLYYRLNAIEIFLWPLYLRPEDLPLLIYCFIQKYNNEITSPIQAVTRDFLNEALLYRWPGNIRELQNRVARACHTAQWQTGEKDCLIGLGIQPTTNRERILFLSETVPLHELPGFSTRNFLEQMDGFLALNDRRQWTIGSRAGRLDLEKEDSKEQQDPIEALLDLPFAEVKRRYVQKLVEKCGGNVEEAARQSGKGMSANTIRRLIQMV